jgi:hypothetical protein
MRSKIVKLQHATNRDDETFTVNFLMHQVCSDATGLDPEWFPDGKILTTTYFCYKIPFLSIASSPRDRGSSRAMVAL